MLPRCHGQQCIRHVDYSCLLVMPSLEGRLGFGHGVPLLEVGDGVPLITYNALSTWEARDLGFHAAACTPYLQCSHWMGG